MKRWPTKLLGEVCTINPKLAASDAPAVDSEVTFVPMAAVDESSGTISRPELRQYRQVAKGYTSFRENDVLFAKITPCMENGKAAIARGLVNGIGFGSTEFHVLRPSSDVLSAWVFAFIRQPAFRLEAQANFTGTAGQRRVPSDFMKRVPITVPPLAEQKRVVKLLDEADRLRKLRVDADGRTADVIPALFYEMFKGDATKRRSWPIKPLGEVVSRVTKGESPAWQGFKYTADGPIFITSENVLWGSISVNGSKRIPPAFHQKLSRSALQEGDVLLNLVGASIGRSCLVPKGLEPANVNQAVAVISCGEQILPEFLMNLLLSREAQRYFHGGKVEAARANISLGDIRKYKTFLPPLMLQKEFARQVAETRALEAQQLASRTRMDDLFQSMLHRAFSGEL